MTHAADGSAKGAPDSAPVKGQLGKEFARVTRALRTLSAGNRTLLRASDEQELLREMCRVIVETGGYRVACVGYAEHDQQKSIRWMAAVGTEMTFLQALHATWDDTELGRGAVARAIRTGQPSVGNNFLTDPAYAGPAYTAVRADAIQKGYSSATAFPLRLNGQVFGGLVMGAAEPDAFDAQEMILLSELADDLAYGIANLRLQLRHRAAQDTIARLAFYDTLTALPNRALLLKRMAAAIDAAKQQHRSLALLHLDIGRFHEFNRVLGYRAGDELLLQLGRRLECAIDPESLSRVGEAEFAVLLPDGSAEHAVHIAQRLLATLGEPVEVAGLTFDARIEIGIALYPCHGGDAETLVRRAFAALHQVNPDRGGYAIYAGGREQEHTRRLALMGDLHRALSQNELRLYCQPKVDIASRRVCGAEALVRWQHPAHGMVSPSEFIRLAEQAGMITRLTNWMLEAAFSQSYAWLEAGVARALAINLSAHDLYDPGMIDRISGMFSTWGIPPELIQFELTESVVMGDPAAALDVLTRLKRLGIQLFIDDYGTGYSSLSYLQKLPVDAIKIDQSFVAPMVASRDSSVIVSSTIELGHRLGLKVVAEGVETKAIWDRLAELDCDTAQGYLISMPLPAEQVLQWEHDWL